MAESTHDRLGRVRPPRVHVRYESGPTGPKMSVDLPFVVGVIGDYAGDSTSLKEFPDRQFVEIDRDNFDGVLGRLGAKLEFSVPYKIDESEKKDLPVSLSFKKMADFEPENIVEQVPALKELLAIRNQLSELLSVTDRSRKLEQILEKLVDAKDGKELLTAFRRELNLDA